MALNDVWEFLLQSSFAGVRVLNRFHYVEIAAGNGVAADYAREVWDAGKAEIRALHNSAVTFQSITARNLTDEVGLGVYSPSAGEQSGTFSGEYLPPFVCTTFRLNRVSAETRHGYKRFSGVSEEGFNSGVPTVGMLTNIQNMALWLVEQISGTLSGNTAMVLKPAIISYFEGGQPRPAPIVRFPTTCTYVGLGTQNSRKS